MYATTRPALAPAPVLPVSLLVFVLVLAAHVLACGGTTPPPSTGTPPPAGTIRYLVGGDSRDDHAHVTPWALREAKARGASGFFFLGDMELTPGLDGHFEKELAELDPIPFYPVLGNHEVKFFGFAGAGQKEAEHAFRERFLGNARTPVKSSLHGKVVYSVDLPGGVHFVALDNVSQNGFGADQLAWLADDLDRARSDANVKHIIVGMHKPLAKNGVSSHSMEADGPQGLADSDAALALFVKAKVSLLVASHVHEFAQGTISGIPIYITGGLGAPLVGSAGPDHAFHHFLQIDVAGDALHVSVVRFGGKPVLGDDVDRD
ncbi:MAG: metallophosphoesterase family protein [Polyangiaceae bacterium]